MTGATRTDGFGRVDPTPPPVPQPAEGQAIWKFSIPLSGKPVNVTMPVGAQILDLQMQGRIPTAWALVNPEAPTEVRTFRTVGTGHAEVVPGLSYIATVQDGAFVWHFFEVVA